jgi:hypothetical protein
MISVGAQDQIVSLAQPGEILFSVIDDMVRSQGTGEVRIPPAAYRGHFRSERLGDLHGEGSHASRGAVDQDPMSFPDASRILKGLQRGQGRQRNRRRRFEGEPGRLSRQPVLRRAGVFGEGPAGQGPQAAEDLVSRLPSPHAPAHRLDLARDIGAQDLDPGFAETEHQPHQKGIGPHDMPVGRVHGGRPDLHQDLVVFRDGPGKLARYQIFGRAVMFEKDRFHRGRSIPGFGPGR